MAGHLGVLGFLGGALLAIGVLSGAEAQATVEHLQYLFDRPAEPVFTAKEGDKSRKKVVFDVPRDYLTNRQQKLDNQVISRFGEKAEHIPVRKLGVDLSVPAKLPKNAQFSLFIPEHKRLATRLIQIFMGMRSLDDFLSVAVHARNVVNPYLFIYAYSVALLHREDTKNAHLPPLAELFPEKYVEGGVLSRAREETNVAVDPQQRIPLEIPRDFSASDLEEEHKMAYWREDIGINLHHWHWHLVFPSDGPDGIVNKDRRGEIFYYSHQQIIARYNFERFCNGLQRVKRMVDFREPIVEGYFPKLDTLIASRAWPSRAANMKLADINREADGMQFDVQDLERWRDRIYEAIHTGIVVNLGGSRQNLTEFGGVDLLGHIIEATALSPNKALYGDMHNFGHVMIAFVHDPDGRHLESFAIMGDTAINLRDPVFYRFHSFVDDMFQEHKKTLPPYSVQQLDFPGVQVKGVEVVTTGARRSNEFFTYWQQSDVDLSRGLDFTPRGPIFARFTHLQHRPFTYRIQVENSGSGQRQGYVRIFMAPKFDERGVPMLLRDQRLLMIELDKFPFNLNQRNNVIERSSTLSSVTIPFERTFRNVDRDRPTSGAQLEQFNFCGCGWPHHLLIPKGTPQGMAVQLFVMITDYSRDRVDQPDTQQCRAGTAYCGLHRQKYPDKRPMGFPFDRNPRQGGEQLRGFLTKNMFVADAVIRFQDVVEVPAGRNTTSVRG